MNTFQKLAPIARFAIAAMLNRRIRRLTDRWLGLNVAATLAQKHGKINTCSPGTRLGGLEMLVKTSLLIKSALDWAQGGPIISNHIFSLEDGDTVEEWPDRWLAEGGGALEYGPLH